MYKRASRSSIGPLLALTLALAPAFSFAQTNNNNNSNPVWQMTSTTYNEFNAGPGFGRVSVMQALLDKGYTHHDLVAIYPLLIDLRDERDMCRARMDTIYTDMMLTHHEHLKSGDMRLQDCQRALTDKQNSIWNTISARVGNDKAMALRRLVEPTTDNVSIAYTDTIIQSIDQNLRELDRLTAARIAANGGNANADNNGVRQASVETTTTTTTVTPTPIYVTTPATINERELVDVVRDRIAADVVGNSDAMIFMPMERDLTSPDLTFLWDTKWKVWH